MKEAEPLGDRGEALGLWQHGNRASGQPSMWSWLLAECFPGSFAMTLEWKANSDFKFEDIFPDNEFSCLLLSLRSWLEQDLAVGFFHLLQSTETSIHSYFVSESLQRLCQARSSVLPRRSENPAVSNPTGGKSCVEADKAALWVSFRWRRCSPQGEGVASKGFLLALIPRPLPAWAVGMNSCFTVFDNFRAYWKEQGVLTMADLKTGWLWSPGPSCIVTEGRIVGGWYPTKLSSSQLLYHRKDSGLLYTVHMSPLVKSFVQAEDIYIIYIKYNLHILTFCHMFSLGSHFSRIRTLSTISLTTYSLGELSMYFTYEL